MEVYYHLKAEPEPGYEEACGIPAFNVRLLTATEDGYQLVAAIPLVSTEELDMLRNAWRQPSAGGIPELVRLLCRRSTPC